MIEHIIDGDIQEGSCFITETFKQWDKIEIPWIIVRTGKNWSLCQISIGLLLFPYNASNLNLLLKEMQDSNWKFFYIGEDKFKFEVTER